MCDDVTAQITSLLRGFTKESHRGLCEAVATAREGITDGQKELDAFAATHEAEAMQVAKTADTLIDVLHAKEREGGQIKEDGVKVG